MKTNAQLKAEAKAVLNGRWTKALLLCLIPSLIGATISLIFTAPIVIDVYQNGFDIFQTNTTGGSFSRLLSSVLTSIFTAGIAWTFLDMLRGDKEEIEPTKDIFRAFYAPFLGAILLLAIVISIFISLWMLLLVIPGIIKMYSYSQSYNIFYDTYRLTGEKPKIMDTITASRKMMDGHKWQAFVLDLSFIGWIILAILSLGIGLLWLVPYMEATKAAFYNNLPKDLEFNA